MLDSNPEIKTIDTKQQKIAIGSNTIGDLQTLGEHVKQVIPSEEFLSMDLETKLLHEKTITSFVQMEENVLAFPVLAQYCDTLEKSDLRSIVGILGAVKGAEQIVQVARGNYIKQADRLLIGAEEIMQNGHTVINNFGTPKAFHSVDEIIVCLEEIGRDMQGIVDLIEKRVSGADSNELFAKILEKLERYMFDGSSLEKGTEVSSNTLIVLGRNNSGFIENLQHEHILPENSQVIDGTNTEVVLNEGDVVTIDILNRFSRSALSGRIAMCNDGDRETDNIFLERNMIPETVIVHIPTEDSFSSIKGNHYDYQCLFVDWFRLPEKDRPRVILYTDGFDPPLYIKHSYQGFLFCKSPDELRNVISLADQLKNNLKNELYNPVKLAEGQKGAYDNSDLREWENKTADSYQSLKHIIERINYRNNLYEKHHYRVVEPEETPRRYINTILDLGTGEGRISGMLARLGLNMMGLDISQMQLDRSRTRIIEEGQGLRGENENPGLSHKALLQLREEGLIRSIELSDEEVEKRFLTVQGNFFDMQYVLNQTLVDWKEKFPDIDPYEFFAEPKYDNQYAFSDERDMFADVGFDMAMFNWHTFCEVGSIENQKIVLEQILNVLNPGGELVLEIPDRKFEPYASALRAYHAEHPDEPYGTIRDPKPKDFQGLEGEDLYPPRYFPDINELILLLKSVGYELDIDKDIQTYLVEDVSSLDGERTLTLKENFITARKSK